MSFRYGIISNIAGSIEGFKDGCTNESLFNRPNGITISRYGTLYVSDSYNHRIRKISTNGTVSTIAGSIYGFKDGNAKKSLFSYPCGITISCDGTLYIADSHNNRIRKISTGIVSTVAGSNGGFRDGNVNDALFSLPQGITISRDGTLFVADTGNHRIRKISTNGIVSTVGGSIKGFKDGRANDSIFDQPCAIAISYDGTLYIAEAQKQRIRKISNNGITSTISSHFEFEKENMENEPFIYTIPRGIAISNDDTLYAVVIDSKNGRISINGIVYTTAESERGFIYRNIKDALFCYPNNITISYNNIIYSTDEHNHRIMKISPNFQYFTIKLLLYDNNYCDI